MEGERGRAVSSGLISLLSCPHLSPTLPPVSLLLAPLVPCLRYRCASHPGHLRFPILALCAQHLVFALMVLTCLQRFLCLVLWGQRP